MILHTQKFNIIGDIHGDFTWYRNFCATSPYPTIQIGDFGLGFSKNRDRIILEWLRENPSHRILRGNHDCPGLFQICPNYLGDYGYDSARDLFWLSGAYSIDWEKRTENIDWWRDEELSYSELQNADALYAINKPSAVISHDCPEFVGPHILEVKNAYYGGEERSLFNSTRTGLALEKMWHFHKPKEWYFGHWHFPFDKVIDGTRFVCVDTNTHITVEFPLNDK